MSGQGARVPLESSSAIISWQQLPALARAFGHFDRLMDSEARVLTPLSRGLALARLSHRLTSCTRGEPTGLELLGLTRAWGDARVSLLPVSQRAALLFVTGAALGLRSTCPQEAERLLAGALALARSTSHPSEWAPFEGPSPQALPRQRPFCSSDWDDVYGRDPSGDPQEVFGPSQAEPLPLALSQSQPVPVAQILDGLDVWQAVLQTHLGWPVGDMAALGRPRLEAWGEPSWLDPAWADETTRTFLHILAGEARAA